MTVSRTGTGAVADTLATQIITCGAACTGTYRTSPITLHAATTGGIPFTSWGGDCASAGSSADCTLSLTKPTLNVSATFGVCAPGAGSCSSDKLTTCDATGQWGTPDPCALGCYTDGTRCYDVDPSNGLGAALDDSPKGPALVLTDGASIDADSGTVVNGDGTVVSIPSVIIDQSSMGGNYVRVFEVKSAHLGTTRIVGYYAFALVSDGDVIIDGELQAYGDASRGGPGGGYCGILNGNGGSSYTPMGSTLYAGGGGGSRESTGAAGGKNGVVAGGKAGSTGGISSLVPLEGGCGGGDVTSYSGKIVANIEALGGYGGGAVQIVSRTSITVQATTGHVAAINVGGGGGMAKGGGGASGGSILLEAPAVVVTGQGAALAANGGGGGGGCANAGSHGLSSAAPAPGGACSGSTTSGGRGQR